MNPELMRSRQLTGGLTMFFFLYLVQMGVFFVVPLYLSVASACPRSRRRAAPAALDHPARGGDRGATPAPERLAAADRPARDPFDARGHVVLMGALDADAGGEVVTIPLLLIGLGIGPLASQLGAVTVSAVPDEQSPEVGGIQNTVTNLGASIGTALAGSILIAVMTESFLSNIEQSPAIPAWSRARPASSSRAACPSSRTPSSRTASRTRARAATTTRRSTRTPTRGSTACAPRSPSSPCSRSSRCSSHSASPPPSPGRLERRLPEGARRPVGRPRGARRAARRVHLRHDPLPGGARRRGEGLPAPTRWKIVLLLAVTATGLLARARVRRQPCARGGRKTGTSRSPSCAASAGTRARSSRPTIPPRRGAAARGLRADLDQGAERGSPTASAWRVLIVSGLVFARVERLGWLATLVVVALNVALGRRPRSR